MRQKLNKVTLFILVFVAFFIFFKYELLFSYLFNAYKYNHIKVVNEYFRVRQNFKTSNLGEILFKNVEPPDIVKRQHDKIFTVLIWKFWERLKNRHIYNFRDKSKPPPDPLQNCAVKNCIFVSDDTFLSTADAVVIHLQSGLLPNVTDRNLNQRWIFLNDESPRNAFSWANKKPKLEDFFNIFNWSMTYRTDADIPVPYGRTIHRNQSIVTNLNSYSEDHLLKLLVPYIDEKRSDILASILISNCGPNRRMEILKLLQENHIAFDIFGSCAHDASHKNRCPGHFRKGCDVTSQYLFYLVFENSECKEYLTEKGFYNAYSKGAIPVIYGPPLEDCEVLLPPNSFLHVDQFKSVEELARYMQSISDNASLLLSYHKWRNDFEILNEHGYFGTPSMHYCRVCEALNYNDDAISIYDEQRLRYFLDPRLNCKH